MVEDEILQRFLEKASQRAMDEIKKEGKLSEENAIPLILKAQFNYIAHLDIELSELRKTVVTKDEFKSFKTEMRCLFGIVLALISSLMAILVF